ncbi:MAG TPA: GTPase HflX, partial [Acidimicrobiales bacterium]
ELIAFNKVDRLGPDDAGQLGRLRQRYPGSVVLSAMTGEGVEGLLTALGDRLRAMFRIIELVVPYERGDVVAALHRHGEVLAEEHEAQATRLRARLHEVDVPRFADFRVA